NDAKSTLVANNPTLQEINKLDSNDSKINSITLLSEDVESNSELKNKNNDTKKIEKSGSKDKNFNESNLNSPQNLNSLQSNKLRFNTSDVQIQKYTSVQVDDIKT